MLIKPALDFEEEIEEVPVTTSTSEEIEELLHRHPSWVCPDCKLKNNWMNKKCYCGFPRMENYA